MKEKSEYYGVRIGGLLTNRLFSRIATLILLQK